MNISKKCGACSNQRHRPYHFLQDHKPARGAISSFFGKRTFRGISESLHNSTTRLAGIREGQESLEKGATEGTAPLEGNSPAKAAESRADDVLPDSLGDSLLQAGQATNRAMDNGVMRCLVEVLLPEFWDSSSGAVFAEEGDQQRFWKLTRKFVDSLAEADPAQKIRIVYPDVGVAAMLQNTWKDSTYGISSLTDRRPVEASDDLVVLAAPDPQGLEACKAVASEIENQRPLILFNPRLASGDVGVGLNVRRMRSRFLSTFTTTYCLRPVGDIGSVFRCYPSLWQVFVEDTSSPGRFNLVAERPSRPAGEALDVIIMDYFGQPQPGSEGSPQQKASFLGQLQGTLQSLQRFARQLSQ